jgi:hypothetical protein
MAVSRALRRLLRIRELQEEQSRLALESSLGELNRLEDAMKATASQDRRGRLLLDASARTGELPDRVSGLEESRTATRIAAVLVPRIEARTSGREYPPTGVSVLARGSKAGESLDRRSGIRWMLSMRAGAASRRSMTGTVPEYFRRI